MPKGPEITLCGTSADTPIPVDFTVIAYFDLADNDWSYLLIAGLTIMVQGHLVWLPVQTSDPPDNIGEGDDILRSIFDAIDTPHYRGPKPAIDSLVLVSATAMGAYIWRTLP